MLARFRGDGWLDETFGTRGATRTPVQDLGHVVALQLRSDGRIVSVFSPKDPAADTFGLARYLPDGQIDPSFGSGRETMVAGVEPAAAPLTRRRATSAIWSWPKRCPWTRTRPPPSIR